MSRLNPAQHRLFLRHVDRAIEALREADRLLKGAVADIVGRMEGAIRDELAAVDADESRVRRFALAELDASLVSYLDNPFAQSVAFNQFCDRNGQSHTQGQKEWKGGNAAVQARNLVFLPPVFADLWEQGLLDKTRLVAIANRNLTAKGYLEVADLVRTRRREDVDERLLRMGAGSVQVGRRGPGEAMKAAAHNGWIDRFLHVEIASGLVEEALGTPAAPIAAPEPDAQPRVEDVRTPAQTAARTLRAGLSGAAIAPEVLEALERSPDPGLLVEKYLKAHRASRDPDPAQVTKTLFFAHAGPMQRLEADDKLLLRHFRPVKTQKRGQLFYRILEVIEQLVLENIQHADPQERGITEAQAMDGVRRLIVELNKDPNRFLVVPDAWLGELTRRHLYFGSRTRKEGAAYKWFRKIGARFYLGSHKTAEEVAERNLRRQAKGGLVDTPDEEE